MSTWSRRLLPAILGSSFTAPRTTHAGTVIVADRLPVRFQMQLHKLLWNDEPGR